VTLEIAIALVGVVVPGEGIVSAEAADETTIAFDAAFNGYDAAVDVAASYDRTLAGPATHCPLRHPRASSS
jgi:hypothetical protein